LTNSLPTDNIEGEREETCNDLRLILGGIVILFTTVSTRTLSSLLALPEKDVVHSITELHSILDIPKNPTHPLRLHHDSFRKFLLSKKRCQGPNLRVDERHARADLIENCIQIMSSVLKEDICDVSAPGILASDLSEDCVRQRLDPEAQYSCLYWVSHVARSGRRLTGNDVVHKFLQKHILHWIEAMSWMGKTSEAVNAMTLPEMMTKVTFSTLAMSHSAMISVFKSNMELGRQVYESPCCCLRCETVSDVHETVMHVIEGIFGRGPML
jgi:hypothetical protein